MRKLTRLLSLSVLLLPGCVLAVHDGDWDDRHNHKPSSLEQRVSDLERRVQQLEQSSGGAKAPPAAAPAEKAEKGAMEVHEVPSSKPH